MRYPLLLLCCLPLVFGGTETKPKAEDYPAHGQTGNIAIGAEYTVRSYSCGEQMYVAQDYLVVEVALFPPKFTTFEVHRGDFSLRINGKSVLDAADPQMVIEDMKHPEFRTQSLPHTEVGGAVDNHGVVFGGPPINSHPFPDSQVPNTPPAYPPVEIPRDNPSGVKQQPVDPYELLLQTSLEEGQHHAAIGGYLYFPFRGKIKSVKTLELLYQDVTLKLQ